jgi:hypothetical protein
MHGSLSIGLLILAVILIALGGFLDVGGNDRLFGLSKQHYWSDGIFALVLSGWVLLWNHVRAGREGK